jgi:hypothetical protein
MSACLPACADASEVLLIVASHLSQNPKLYGHDFHNRPASDVGMYSLCDGMRARTVGRSVRENFARRQTTMSGCGCPLVEMHDREFDERTRFHRQRLAQETRALKRWMIPHTS